MNVMRDCTEVSYRNSTTLIEIKDSNMKFNNDKILLKSRQRLDGAGITCCKNLNLNVATF